MKLKLLVKVVEMVLGLSEDSNTPRADMYMPERLLAMALVLFVAGAGCAVFFVLQASLWMIVAAVLCIGLGVAAVLCWKNQAIHVISDEEFTHTTMFGNTYTYAFSDVKGFRQNQDSTTLFVADKKIHIESMAVLSDRFVDRINQVLQEPES